MRTVTSGRRRSVFRPTRPLLVAGLILSACGLMPWRALPAVAADELQLAASPPPSPSQTNPDGGLVCAKKVGNHWFYVTCPGQTASGGTAGTPPGAATGGGKSPPPVVCPSSGTGSVPSDEACNLASPIARGRPRVTPHELAVDAYGVLALPTLAPGTAPPRGKDGLVGLPEWFWVPAASWHAISLTVRAGPVWATVTATPVGLRFDPGPRLWPVSCAGPGNAYDKAAPVDDQSTTCDYTYLQSSADQPGGVYHATLNVLWRVTWIGSGGPGGVLENADAMPAPFTIKVVQAEALVTGSS